MKLSTRMVLMASGILSAAPLTDRAKNKAEASAISARESDRKIKAAEEKRARKMAKNARPGKGE